jgi:hypothetical protein
MPETRFLFRLDMAKDNDEFMNLRRPPEPSHVYSGRPLKLGPGWIPDFVEIHIDEPSGACTLTLIELEAREAEARASCRKYLPEPGAAVIKSFLSYLDSVISECRSTSDQRLGAFENLRTFLERSPASVHTAAALRRSSDFLENLPLMDQGASLPARAPAPKTPLPGFSLKDNHRLTRAESVALVRAVRIFHAVLTARDRSATTLYHWQKYHFRPLEQAVERQKTRYVHLSNLLSSSTVPGLDVDCLCVAAELARLWSAKAHASFTPERVTRMLEAFIPVILGFDSHVPMKNVFAHARRIIGSTVLS